MELAKAGYGFDDRLEFAICESEERLRVSLGGVFFLVVGGRKIFPVVDESGRQTGLLAAVIVQILPTNEFVNFGRRGLHERDGGRWYVAEWDHQATPEEFQSEIAAGVKALSA